MERQAQMKARYSLLVSRANEPIGEYVFRATDAGLQELKDKIKPEFSYTILSNHAMIHEHKA